MTPGSWTIRRGNVEDISLASRVTAVVERLGAVITRPPLRRRQTSAPDGHWFSQPRFAVLKVPVFLVTAF